MHNNISHLKHTVTLRLCSDGLTARAGSWRTEHVIGIQHTYKYMEWILHTGHDLDLCCYIRSSTRQLVDKSGEDRTADHFLSYRFCGHATEQLGITEKRAKLLAKSHSHLGDPRAPKYILNPSGPFTQNTIQLCKSSEWMQTAMTDCKNAVQHQ